MEIWSKCDICGRDIPVGELCYGLKKGNCICKDCCTGFENCTFSLAPAPTLTPPNEWVSVDEKFPEINQKVIVFLEGMYSMAEFYGTYYDGTPIWSYTGMGGDPTHWMLLPAPPDRRSPEGEEDT